MNINYNCVHPCNTIIPFNPETAHLADRTLANSLMNMSFTQAEGFNSSMSTSDGRPIFVALLQTEAFRNLDPLDPADIHLTRAMQLADINKATQEGITPLIQSICNFIGNLESNTALIEELVRLGANLNSATIKKVGEIPKGATPLWLALEKTHGLILPTLLIFYGAQVGDLPLTNEGAQRRAEAMNYTTPQKIPSAWQSKIPFHRENESGAFDVTNSINESTTLAAFQNACARNPEYRVEFGGRKEWTAFEVTVEKNNIQLAQDLLRTYGTHLLRSSKSFSLIAKNFPEEVILTILDLSKNEGLSSFTQSIAITAWQKGYDQVIATLIVRGGVTCKRKAQLIRDYVGRYSWASPAWKHLIDAIEKKTITTEKEKSLFSLIKRIYTALPNALLSHIGSYMQSIPMTLLSKHLPTNQI